MKNLDKKSLKDFRLQRLGDKESQFDENFKRGCGWHQCGIHPTVAMATDLYPIVEKLGVFINGNNKHKIWD